MTARTVVGTVVLPNGSPPARATVTIELVAATTGAAIGWVPSADVGVGARHVAACDAAGSWSVDLRPNSLISPGGSAYRVTYATVASGHWSSTFYINVPDAVGPHRVEDRLTSPPTALTEEEIVLFALFGTPTPFAGQVGPRIPNNTGRTFTITSLELTAASAPTGGALTVALAVAGSTVATVTCGDGQLTSGQQSVSVGVPAGAVMQASVTAVGPTLAGGTVALVAAGRY